MFRRSIPFVFLAVSFGATGCAFTDLRIEPPPASALTAPSSVGRGREIALSNVFVDLRADTTRCGMQKNGYNMDTADVHCDLTPARWLPDALARALTSAGFVVTASPSPSVTAARIEGEVMQFFVEPVVGAFTFSPEADIEVRLKVATPNGLYAERKFYFKGKETAMSGLEENFQAAAERATAAGVRTMVVAIADLLDRYPTPSPATVIEAPLAAREVPQ